MIPKLLHPSSHRWFILAAAALVANAIAADAATVASLSPQATRSGRIVLRGSGFGAVPGTVKIAGVPAHVADWSDTRISAYVAESTPVGRSAVTLGTATSVEAGEIVVTERPAGEDRIRWRFDADALQFFSRPAEGPDGTVYAVDTSGRLYALTSGGALKWIRSGVNGSQSPSVAPDGTIYVSGVGGLVAALDPADGTTLWVVPYPENAGQIYSGPNVGPDGTIYVVTDENHPAGLDFGLGAISPDGEILWNRSNNFGVRTGSFGYAWETTPGPDGVYFASGQGSPPDNVVGVFSVSAEGSIRWSVNSLMWPQLGSDGNLYLRNVDGNYFASYTPSGSERWRVLHSTIAGTPTGEIALDPASNFYVPSGINLGSADSDGALRWRVNFGDATVQRVGVRPDGGLLVAHCTPFSATTSTSIRGFSPESGEHLWTQELGFDGEVRIVQMWEGRFSADGGTWYVPCTGNNYAPDPIAPLFAIQTGDEQTADLANESAAETAFPVISSPNPAGEGTTISFSLGTPSAVSVEIYGPSGRLVRALVAGKDRPAGRHDVGWDVRDDSGLRVAAGAYFVRVRAGSRASVGRVVVIDR